jgi:hypothetical protein
MYVLSLTRIWAARKSTVIFLKVTVLFREIDPLTHGAEPFLRIRQLCSCSRASQDFMVPEV